MQMMKKLCTSILAVLLTSSFGFGQMKQGAWGITTGYGSGTLDITTFTITPSSPTFGIAYALQPNLRLGVNLGFTSAGSGGATSTTSTLFTIGLSPWYYFGTSENVSAFAGGMLSFSSLSPGGVGTSTSTFNIAGQFGAEYWFSPKFSWYGLLQLGFSSRSVPTGSAATLFGSATSTGLTWYF